MMSAIFCFAKHMSVIRATRPSTQRPLVAIEE